MAKKVRSHLLYLSSVCLILTFIIPGPSVFRALQQCIDDASKTQGQQCILLGIVEQGKIPESISFSNEIEIQVRANLSFICILTSGVQALSEEERFYLLLKQVDNQGRHLAPDISIAALAKQSAALVASDLANLIKKSCLCALLK